MLCADLGLSLLEAAICCALGRMEQPAPKQPTVNYTSRHGNDTTPHSKLTPDTIAADLWPERRRVGTQRSRVESCGSVNLGTHWYSELSLSISNADCVNIALKPATNRNFPVNPLSFHTATSPRQRTAPKQIHKHFTTETRSAPTSLAYQVEVVSNLEALRRLGFRAGGHTVIFEQLSLNCDLLLDSAAFLLLVLGLEPLLAPPKHVS